MMNVNTAVDEVLCFFCLIISLKLMLVSSKQQQLVSTMTKNL